jgi:hypothetical protein
MSDAVNTDRDDSSIERHKDGGVPHRIRPIGPIDPDAFLKR